MEHALPFEVEVPKTVTAAAMKEARSGELASSSSVPELIADLNAED